MTDIEDLAGKQSRYISEDIEEPLINLVKDLCAQNYDNKTNLERKLIELRHKYKIHNRYYSDSSFDRVNMIGFIN